MSKSKGRIVDIDKFEADWGDALIFRYFVLTAKYSKKLPISENAFETAANAYKSLKQKLKRIAEEANQPASLEVKIDPAARKYLNEFREAVGDDLNTPVALAVLWSMLGDEVVPANQKLALVLDFDSVLGLDLLVFAEEEQTAIPADVIEKLEQRQQAKRDKDWKLSDELRAQVESMGYQVQDTPNGYHVLPRKK